MPYDLSAARKRFEAAQAFEQKQQKRELEDLSFYEGEGQWPADIVQARSGQPSQNGMPAVPARPMITVNKVREPIRHVVNEERASDLGVEIVPADDFHELQPGTVSEQEIELREGIVRRIQRESHAIDARIWAAERATIAGRGYYGVMTQYLPGKTWDQELYVRRFYNQGGVLLDQAHEQPDGSDAEEAWVGTWMTLPAYKAAHPKRADGQRNQAMGLGEGEFKTLAEQYASWFQTQNDVQAVRVVENWVYERTARGLALLTDGSVVWEDEIQGALRDSIADVREVIDKAVKFYKLDGFDGDRRPLEQTDWPGHFLPIIKIVGEEIQPYDQERRCEGMVRPTKDSQRGFNYMVSKWVEMIGLTPVPPLMLTPQHVEGFSNIYESMGTRNWPWLPYNDVDPDTHRTLPPPIRPPVATDIAAIAGSVQLFDNAIKSTTAVPDATLGNVDPSVRSGKGIQALALNALKATAHYGDNFERSVNYEGRILNDLLYPIYGRRPGRLLRLFTKERDAKTVRIGPPTQTAMPGLGQAPPQQTDQQQVYTLTPDANFNVAIKVTKNYDTLREQEASTVMETIASAPEYMLPLMGDLAFKYQDGPGHAELAERLKYGLRPEVRAALDGNPQDPQLQQLQAENQQLKQMLATKTAEIQAKGQIDLQKTQLQEQGDNQRRAQDAQVQIAKAEIAANAQIAVAELKAQNDDLTRRLKAVELFLTAQQEARLDREDRTHEHVQNTLDRAHEVALTQLEHQHALEQGQQQAETQSQLSAQNAAQQPT